METIEAYLGRKHEEIRLLNGCLSSPRHVPCPRSVDEVIAVKFQLSAALRGEHELADWKATETSWSATARPTSGPFAFSYDYQRADLKVSGPSFYEEERGCTSEAIYTASGMSAIAALLLATARLVSRGDIMVLPGSYGETLELIEHFVPDLRLVTMKPPLTAVPVAAGAPQFSCWIPVSPPAPSKRRCAATVRRSIS